MVHQVAPGLLGNHTFLSAEETTGFRADPEIPEGKRASRIQLQCQAPLEDQKARWGFINALDLGFSENLGAARMDFDLVPGVVETDQYRVVEDFNESSNVRELRVWMPYEFRRYYIRELITNITQASDKTVSFAASNIPFHVVTADFSFFNKDGTQIGPTSLHVVGRFVEVIWTYTS